MKPVLFSICLVMFSTVIHGQNLPELLTGKNINATFSIVGYDEQRKEWGIAVATNNIYVGNSTVYIEPGVGAFSTIAETEPTYAFNGFRLLKESKTIQEAIEYTMKTDAEAYLRQVGGLDANGNAFAFTGSTLKSWKGNAGHITGKNFVVMGNQLADSVLTAMANTFQQTSGLLSERLLKSLLAGQKAGGQLNGKQSAALVVKGLNNEWFNQVDLRVDHSLTPFDDLQRLFNYHYGRIQLNQAITALQNGNKERGRSLLLGAIPMIEGWNGIYSKVAKAWIMLKDEQKAVEVIKKALAENSRWKENLPAFYCLADDPAIKNLFKTEDYTVADWNNAISMFMGIGQYTQAIELAKKVLLQFPRSAYTAYLLGGAYEKTGDKQQARKEYQRSLTLDPDNQEVRAALDALK
ncbi:MAG: DUF1028 domain-containing protein [Chitinophagaceae bacterium]